MKKKLLFLSVILTFSVGLQAVGSITMEKDSVFMNMSYVNDVYYSMKNGEVASVDRSGWDIAFFTNAFSAAVLTNGPFGVELYTYPNSDTTGWNSIDTTGMMNWPVLHNSAEEWEDGAFNINASGHPDYGWGEYNNFNHDVIGDSIYIMKLTDESYKKFWIVRKYSSLNKYQFRFANLDNSDEVEITIDINNYTEKQFVYYSLTTNEVVDIQPAKDSWDIVFSKYMEDLGIPYPVTGVLNNFNVAANHFEPVDPMFDSWTDEPMDTAKSPVGYGWKHYDFATGWIIHDSVVYFVQTLEGDIYKLVFTDFGGFMTGKVVFEKELISATGINDPVSSTSRLMIHPNPVKDHLNVTIPSEMEGEATFIMYDVSGRVLANKNLIARSGEVHRIELPDAQAGVYVVILSAGNTVWSTKVLVGE